MVVIFTRYRQENKWNENWRDQTWIIDNWRFASAAKAAHNTLFEAENLRKNIIVLFLTRAPAEGKAKYSWHSWIIESERTTNFHQNSCDFKVKRTYISLIERTRLPYQKKHGWTTKKPWLFGYGWTKWLTMVPEPWLHLTMVQPYPKKHGFVYHGIWTMVAFNHGTTIPKKPWFCLPWFRYVNEPWFSNYGCKYPLWCLLWLNHVVQSYSKTLVLEYGWTTWLTIIYVNHVVVLLVQRDVERESRSTFRSVPSSDVNKDSSIE
jgi:hypothetical protein